MNKLRPLRFKNMTVDMTAMCDVAFLLLVFFVFTAQFDQWEPMKIKVPSMDSRTVYLPDDGISVIYISGKRVMYQIVGDALREATFKSMSFKYGVTFSPNDQDKIMDCPIIGAPLCDIKEYDDQYINWTGKVDRPGIPYEKGELDKNELFDWIKESRIVTRALFSKDMRIIIKADRNAPYPTVKRVIAILEQQKVNKFSLMMEDASDKNLR